MNRIWILPLLILAAALPVIIVFFWFRTRKSDVTLPWFLVSLAAGIISLLAAAVVQRIFPRLDGAGQTGPGQVFFDIFFRIALVEEASRFVILILLFKAVNCLRKPVVNLNQTFAQGTRVHFLAVNKTFGAALGLVAGLGFAMLENASYGTADVYITLLRGFTAAPLHGACGIRTGVAASVIQGQPVKAFWFFLSAVLIHGAYNLMIISPALPSVLAVLVAFVAFFASLPFVKTPGSGG